MVVSIHQPNFCPYEGFFEKMAASDVFVLLNHAQFPKNNFVNRFNFEDKWYTMRVNQSHVPIIKKYYLHARADWESITRRQPKLKVFDDCLDKHLAQMNGAIIRKAAELLKIDTKICYDHDTELKGTERLVCICKAIGAKTYLSGISGKNYLDLKLFEQAGIKVVFQENPKKRALCEIL